MISHKYKCIFIHIPRTAGTSIEHWIDGENWWYKKKEEKHLLASQAKKLYAEYWDQYFKFSFVRNPWDRMVSCLRFITYSVEYDGELHLEKYREKFGFPILVEHDVRFSSRSDVLTPKHTSGCVYLNILDEELDFIGKYENLESDIAFLKDKLNIPEDFSDTRWAASKDRSDFQDYYSPKTVEEVAKIFEKDLERFDYRWSD